MTTTTCERCNKVVDDNDTRVSKTGDVQWICPCCQAQEGNAEYNTYLNRVDSFDNWTAAMELSNVNS